MLGELFELVNRSFLFFLVQIISIIVFIINFINYRKKENRSLLGSLVRAAVIPVVLIVGSYIVALILYLLGTSFLLIALIIVFLMVVFLS